MKHNKGIQEIEVKFEVVKTKLEICQQFVTHEGFFQYWFEQLGKPENRKKTKEEIFEDCNDLFRAAFNTDVGKYSSYDSFRTTTSRMFKNKRNDGKK